MLKIDLHVHTIASGHAQSTILEYINQAKKLKMKVLGISDHGPNNSETIVSEIYFKSLRRIPKKIGDLRILKGIEANIINVRGDIDIDDSVIERLDYVMANLHKKTSYRDLGKKTNTAAVIKTIRSGKVNIISHPFLTRDFAVDVKKVSEEACKSDVLLELNLSCLDKNKIKPATLANVKIMIAVVKQHKKKVIIGSDAHNIWELADDFSLKGLQKQIGLTDNLVINNYPRELFKLLKIV